MTKHTVTATFQVEVTDPTALNAIAGSSGDEASRLQSAADAGVKELSRIAGRWGVDVTSASATVEPGA